LHIIGKQLAEQAAFGSTLFSGDLFGFLSLPLASSVQLFFNSIPWAICRRVVGIGLSLGSGPERPGYRGRRGKSAGAWSMATILLVEDHPMNRKLVRDILLFQFEVEEAVSAEAAQEYLRTHRPDLILLDIQLPGMDGLSLMRQLKAEPATADIPIVALSAHAMTRDIDLARQAGCVDYITKPITDDPFTFLDRIANSLNAAHMGS
jgi:two-component system cell cycle response regulator DivK